jgi:broad specificity phosphatase PhoE
MVFQHNSPMGTLYLVRHGQASFGAANYDQLSALGKRQSERLGEYWRSQGLQFEAVLTGTLRRHAQTWAGIAQGAGYPDTPLAWPGLNEYDSAALIAAIHPEPLTQPNTPELYRHHFRLLRQALLAWIEGQIHPVGMPSFTDFSAGITSALDHVRAHHSGAVLMVTSGGPIATAISHVLGAPASATIELNMRIRNSAVSELAYTPKRHMLQTFNTLPHLDALLDAHQITYA